MGVFREIPIAVSMETPEIKSLILYANSTDAIMFEVTNNGSNETDFTGFTCGVRIYTGTDYTAPSTVFRRPATPGAAPSTTGVTYPDGASAGRVRVALQPEDLVARDGIVTLELWATHTGGQRVLVTLLRINVVTNTEAS